MSFVRSQPCSACPYRCDVASGVWAAHEYDKLIAYDRPTGEQPFAGFSCHATPEAYCHGWAVVHMSRGHAYELLALRLDIGWDGELGAAGVPLFASGAEAAAHGKAEIEAPSPEAKATVARLTRKYPRLETDG